MHKRMLTVKSTESGAQACASCSACNMAKGMLVPMAAKIFAGRLHEGCPEMGLMGRGGRLRVRLPNQSHAVARDGRRNPRKASSSNAGAMKTPKMLTIQIEVRVRKKSSMGSVLGMGRKLERN